jgi:hypothetical protein
LELIARLFWPTTEAFRARHDALELDRFLDVGCGIGDVASRIGNARPDIGCELAVMLRGLGATDVRVELIQPTLSVRDDLQGARPHHGSHRRAGDRTRPRNRG